ncbi:MAG: hypothetical protein E7576_03685 [Ruminococcaceae bacterium]|nr:hypothetical protein [Oscillospiraceae bacterium]
MKKRKIVRIFSAVFAFLLLSLSACRKEAARPGGEENPDAEKENVETADPNILTNVYEAAAQSEEKRLVLTGVKPYCEPETGRMTCVTMEYVTMERDGEEIRYAVIRLTTVSKDGEVTERVLRDDPDDPEGIGTGFLTADELVCTLHSEDENGNRRAYLSRLNLAEGSEWERGAEILSLFNQQTLTTCGLVRASDGSLCAASDREILVLSPEGSLLRSVIPDTGGDEIFRMVTSEDGRVFAGVIGDSGGTRVAEIFPETGTSGPFVGLGDLGGNLMDGAGGYVYCYDNNDGVWGRTFDGEGNPSDEMILDFFSSGLSQAESSPVSVADGAVYMLVYKGFQLGGRFDGGILTCFTPGEDIDLTGARTLTVACFGSLTTSMTAAVNDFRREHPDVRVLLDDWSRYDTEENPAGGSDKLTRDMVTGLYKPDILLGGRSDPYMQQVLAHRFYTDLTPFLKTDETVNLDNLFDCVERMFDDGAGGIWGVTPNFTVRTLVSTPELLGSYAEKGYWTLEDALDYVESMPEGCEFVLDFTREMHTLMGAGAYMQFIDRDNAVCSFTDPVFIRYLNFIKTLPSFTEYRAKSPYRAMDGDELAGARLSGKIRVSVGGNAGVINSVGMIRRFVTLYGTKDWTMIGYPVPVERAGAGTIADTRYALVMTSFCEAPDLAWDLIRRAFSGDAGQGGIPALVSTFDAFIEHGEIGSWYDTQFEDLYAHHGYTGKTRRLSEAIGEDEMEFPGVLSTFTREERDKYVKIFDEIGVPAYEAGIPEVFNIIYEETSAFLGGVGSAEDCAKKIQSRVSIWLAEHK